MCKYWKDYCVERSNVQKFMFGIKTRVSIKQFSLKMLHIQI